MNMYRIWISLRGCKSTIWERFGDNTEAALASAKIAAAKEYADEWTGGIMICGDQGDGVYAF